VPTTNINNPKNVPTTVCINLFFIIFSSLFLIYFSRKFLIAADACHNHKKPF